MLKRFVPVGFLLVLFAAPEPAYAEEEICAEIVSAIERLDCYDRQYRDRQARGNAATGVSRDRPTYQSRRSAPSTVTADAAPMTPSPSAEPIPEKKGLFSWGSSDTVRSEIAGVRRGEQQRMVFRLNNGQIWMQNTPRTLPFEIGDLVTIKSGRFGGYVMRSDRGTSTRVKPLE